MRGVAVGNAIRPTQRGAQEVSQAPCAGKGVACDLWNAEAQVGLYPIADGQSISYSMPKRKGEIP